MAIFLQVASGKNAGQEIPVRGSRFLIGRAEDCHLRAHSEQISRYHCALLVERGGAFIRDYGSRNGTFVDGHRVLNQQAVHDGQKLQVGPLSFVISIRKTVATGGSGVGKDTVLGKSGSDTLHAGGGGPEAPANEASVKQAAQTARNAPEPLDVLEFLNEPDAPKASPHSTTISSLEEFLAAEKAAADLAADKKPEAPPGSDDQTRDAALEGLKKFFTPKKQ
jgi:pSer/pThr/pTyr-binding forkhead associated (FHA) protein